MQTINLSDCEYHASKKTLTVNCKIFSRKFPMEFAVKSHHTGNTVVFKRIPYDHPKHDPDSWDGEQMVYEPTHSIKNIDTLILHF